MEELLSERYEQLKALHERLWNIQVACRRGVERDRDARAMLISVRTDLDLLCDDIRLARDQAKVELDKF